MRTVLWSEPLPRTRRTVFTVLGSVVLHGSIIAIAALWPVRHAPSAPPELPPLTGEQGPELMPIPESAGPASEPPAATAEPPPPSEPAADLPPEEMPLTLTLAPPKAAPKTAVNKPQNARSPLTTTSTHGEHLQAGTPGGSAGGHDAGARAGMAGRWKTPQPPYPYALRAARVQGSGLVRITTDGSGRVVNASVVQSTGNALLDANTNAFARTGWSGPPNASTDVPITYQLR